MMQKTTCRLRLFQAAIFVDIEGLSATRMVAKPGAIRNLNDSQETKKKWPETRFGFRASTET